MIDPDAIDGTTYRLAAAFPADLPEYGTRERAERARRRLGPLVWIEEVPYQPGAYAAAP